MGYQINHWLAIEGGYDYLGQSETDYPALEDSTQRANYEAKVQGVELGLKADYYLLDNIALFAKAGMFGWRAETQSQELSYAVDKSDDGVSPMLGGGLEYHLSSNWVSRLEYQWVDNVGGDDTGGADSHLVTLGLRYKFGGSEPAPVVQELVAPIVVPEPVIIEKYTRVMNEQSGKEIFKLNSDELSSAMMTSLQPILKRMLTYPQAQLAIIGHTDAAGAKDYNQTLSERRAQNVAKYLISEGVSPNNITISGVGESSPIADNHTAAGRAENRRVEFNSPEFTISQDKEL